MRHGLLLSFPLFMLLSLLSPAAANSANFTLKLYAPGTELSECNLYVASDYKFYIANTTTTVSGYIINNSSLIIDDMIVGIGKNYLSLTSDSSSFEIADPFTISGGRLKLYGSDFHALPSGEDGIYVLGSINAAAGRSDVIDVAIDAEDSDGETLADYTPSGASVISAASDYAATPSGVSILASVTSASFSVASGTLSSATGSSSSTGKNHAAIAEIPLSLGSLLMLLLL